MDTFVPMRVQREPDEKLEARLRHLEDEMGRVPAYIQQIIPVVPPPSDPPQSDLPDAADDESLRYNAATNSWEGTDDSGRWLPRTGGTLSGFVLWLLALAADKAVRTQVTGDSDDRFYLQADGKALWGPGNAAQDTNLYRSAANVLGTDDDFAILTAGKGLRVKEGANAKMGTAVLVGGTVTVATTAVTANSRISLTAQVVGGTQGMLSVGTVVAGTSFVINSSDVADTSTIFWMIVEPA